MSAKHFHVCVDCKCSFVCFCTNPVNLTELQRYCVTCSNNRVNARHK